jgi:putative transcriptional regulator
VNVDTRVILKNRLRELRARLALRQDDLAREVGVSRQTILAIEKGRLNPSVTVALKIARILREPVDYVFYLERGVPQGAHSSPPYEAEADHRSGPSLHLAPPASSAGRARRNGTAQAGVQGKEDPSAGDEPQAVFEFM